MQRSDPTAEQLSQLFLANQLSQLITGNFES